MPKVTLMLETLAFCKCPTGRHQKDIYGVFNMGGGGWLVLCQPDTQIALI